MTDLLNKTVIMQHQIETQIDNGGPATGLKLYTSVIDLNNMSSEIIDKHRYNMTDDELRKHVLLNVIVSFEIKWRKKNEMIQIVQYSGYKQQGICDSIKDVDPIN